MPGIRAIATHGYTPGHIIYALEREGERLMLCGDLMHVAAARFGVPATTIRFDTDSKAVAKQRQEF